MTLTWRTCDSVLIERWYASWDRTLDTLILGRSELGQLCLSVRSQGFENLALEDQNRIGSFCIFESRAHFFVRPICKVSRSSLRACKDQSVSHQELWWNILIIHFHPKQETMVCHWPFQIACIPHSICLQLNHKESRTPPLATYTFDFIHNWIQSDSSHNSIQNQSIWYSYSCRLGRVYFQVWRHNVWYLSYSWI